MGNDTTKEVKETKDTKPELDLGSPQFVPQGLYQSGARWDKLTLAKMITEKKLAPYQKGSDEPDESLTDLEECPICFLYYTGGLNEAVCCGKRLCTECYVHIRPICPFCQTSDYVAEFKGPLSQEQRNKELEEQQKVLDIEIRMRLEEIEQDRRREEEKRRTGSLRIPSKPTPEPQTPANSVVSNPLIYDSFDNDEERMLQEAIRLSLVDLK